MKCSLFTAVGRRRCSCGACAGGFDELFLFQGLQNRVKRSQRNVRCSGQNRGPYPQRGCCHSFLRGALLTRRFGAHSVQVLLQVAHRQAVPGPPSARLQARETGCFSVGVVSGARGVAEERDHFEELGFAGISAHHGERASSNVTVVNGLPLLLIITSFFGSERHAGRPCAIEQIKKKFQRK